MHDDHATTTTAATAADAAPIAVAEDPNEAAANPADSVWPTSALAAAERAFAYLTQPPAPLSVDGRRIGHGLPARDIPVDELRYLLVHDPDTTFEAKDACWHLLIDRARTAGPTWVIATAAMALPALTNMARRLCVGYEHVAEDVDSELLAGFLTALRGADLSGPAPYARMCWAGWRAALAARGPRDLQELPDDVFDPSSRLPTRPYGHPDLILGRAVAAGIIITTDQAQLISATRFGRVFLHDLAAAEGVDVSVLRMRRRRSELAVVKALAGGLDEIAVGPKRRRTHPRGTAAVTR